MSQNPKPNFFAAIILIVAAAVLVSVVGDIQLHWIPVAGAIMVLGWVAQAMTQKT